MSPESMAFLNANRGHYEILVRAGYVKHLDIATREGLLNVIHKEWDPGYLSNNWCSECVANMLKFAYVQYDKYLDMAAKAISESLLNEENKETS